jgi:hypothetical protein
MLAQRERVLINLIAYAQCHAKLEAVCEQYSTLIDFMRSMETDE